MLAKKAQEALIRWEAVSSRIITAKFRTKMKNINIDVVQCYAPTNDAEDEKKEEFYDRLQSVLVNFSLRSQISPCNSSYVCARQARKRT